MNKLLSLLLLIPCFFFANSVHSNVFQYRSSNETYQDALNRIKKTIPNNIFARENPLNQKVPITEIDFSPAPKITTYEELMHMFYVIRDSRFLYEKSDFARRISWLYPDDGCFSRAAMTGIKLEKERLVRPAKIFAFGDLMIQTPYSSAGAVYWWYHVAAVVNYMGTMYVLDPALKADGPMLAEEWYNKMGEEKNLKGIVCNEYTYDPLDYCINATVKSDAYAQRDQPEFLELEWKRMRKLGYDPEKILGDNPPWN